MNNDTWLNIQKDCLLFFKLCSNLVSNEVESAHLSSGSLDVTHVHHLFVGFTFDSYTSSLISDDFKPS